MIYLVRISRDLVAQGLTLGYEMRGTKVIEGLPEGCELIAANIESHGTLILSFLKNGDKEDKHKIFEQTITVQTLDSRETER